MKPRLALLGLGVLLAGAAARHKLLAVGEQAPPFVMRVANPASSGMRSFSLKKFCAAHKASLISFYATYCQPCQQEMPYLVGLHRALKDKGLGVTLVGIDKDPEKQKQLVPRLERAGARFPVIADRFQIVAKRFGVERLPRVFVLDQEHRVVFSSEGFSPRIRGRLEARLASLLGTEVASLMAGQEEVPIVTPGSKDGGQATATGTTAEATRVESAGSPPAARGNDAPARTGGKGAQPAPQKAGGG